MPMEKKKKAKETELLLFIVHNQLFQIIKAVFMKMQVL